MSSGYAMAGRSPASAAEAKSGDMAANSPWNSPVPYLFGGLAAMLGLIAFALLILTCSYWKLSTLFEDGGDDEENGGKDGEAGCKRIPSVSEESVVVIMAGDERPTFLATPISGRASQVAISENNPKSNCSDDVDANGDGDGDGIKKLESGGEGSRSRNRIGNRDHAQD